MSFARGMALKGLAVAVCAFAGLTASAQAADGLSLDDRAGFYAAARGGYAWTSGGDLDIDDGPADIDLDPENMFLGAAAVGYNIGAFRVEAEGNYMWGDADDSLTAAGVAIDLEADYQIIAAMANVFYDIPLADRFTAYVGAGAGAAFGQVEVDATITAFGNEASESEDDDDTGFAYQFMVGVGYQIADRVTLTVGYRFFDTTIEDFPMLHTAEAGVRFDF